MKTKGLSGFRKARLGRSEVGCPGLGRKIARDIASIGVIPADEVILSRGSFVFGDVVAAVAAGTHGCADKLGADKRRLRILEIELQIVDPVEVDVASQHHGVIRTPCGEEFHQPATGRLVPCPLVHADPFRPAGPTVHPRQHPTVKCWMQP